MSPSNQISISPDTITALKNAFNDQGLLKITAIGSSAAAVSSFLAFLTIYQTKKNQREQLIQSVRQQFFEINILLVQSFNNSTNKQSLNKHELQLLANYFDHFAELIKNKKIPFSESENFRSSMALPLLQTFISNYRTKYGDQYFESMVWLEKEIKDRNKRKKFFTRFPVLEIKIKKSK